MSNTLFERASLEDFDDIIDFGDFVFSHAHASLDFLSFLPKLYTREYFMDSIHYLAREDDKIKAVVGAYPLKMEFAGGSSLTGRGIGMVSVHPRSRSKGYMKTLMNMALEDMKNDKMVFSCLSGLRQRYEYFGFTPTGNVFYFSVRESNIRHTLGRQWNTSLSIKALKADDKATLDKIYSLHEAKSARYFRNRDRLYDILCSWKANVYAFFDGEQFEGYLVSKPGSHDITEINLAHPSRFCEAIGLFLRTLNEKNPHESIMITVGPHEAEKITALSKFAEHCHQTSAYQFNIFDFQAFLKPFLEFRMKQRALAEGSLNLIIKGVPESSLQLSVRGGKADIKDTSSSPDIILDPLEATKFFFSPISAATNPIIGEKVFLQSLLPLPLFFENPDGI